MAQNDSLQYYVARFRRRLRLRDGWLLAQRTLWLALAVSAGVQVMGRIWPVGRLGLWTLIPLVGWLMAVLGASLLKPLPSLRVARRVDAELALKERLSTAVILDFSASQLSDLVTLQHRDALAIARAVQIRRAFPLRWLRRPLLLAAVFAVAAAALALLPNPMDVILEERAAIARAAADEAQAIDALREEIERARELSPEEQEELLRQLAELAEQLRANPGDREEALADLSRVEEALRQRIDPNLDARRAALEGLAQQLQALAGREDAEEADPSDAAEALEELAEGLEGMSASEREALAQTLAQMAARAAQSGEVDLAQALSQMAQAAQMGDADAASQSAGSAAEAIAQAQGELADQEALQRALDQLQASRQSVAGAGQGRAVAEGSGQQGGEDGEGQGQGQGQSDGQGQGQSQPGSGGGTQADTLPPARRSGRADDPQGEGEAGAVGELDSQVYVPWERRSVSGDEVSITGPDTGEGETETREQQNPLPGAPGESLVPYHEVYYDYLDAANQTMERSAIPLGLRDFVRDYFSQLEP